MKREDPLILPICNHCGKYKGVGYCKNPACPGFLGQLDEEESETEEDNSKESVNQPCSLCRNDQVLACVQCGQGFCQTHSLGADLNKLGTFHQRVGTCVECHQVVCENCWILNPNGDIVCLYHIKNERKTRVFH
jgi:hypothetical protein